jgi:hypothetical protein
MTPRVSNEGKKSIMAMIVRRELNQRSRGETNERGAVLILALVYIIVVSLVVAALTTWASGDLNNTNNFTAGRNTDYALSSAVEVAINNIRYTPLADTDNAVSQPRACWGTGTTSSLTLPGSTYSISTWCSTLTDADSATSRTVTISACQSTMSNSQCAATPLLQAIVVFDDYSSTGASSTGYGATLQSWDWSSTAGLSPALSNSISVTSGPQAIPLVGQTYLTASSAASGDVVTVTSATPLICTITNANVVSVVNGVTTTTPTSTVNFGANGVCTIDFNDPGNGNYVPATQQTQTMTVGPLANAITVTSRPSNPTEGGTYTTTSSALSGDTVSVTSATPGVCAASGAVVNFVGNGNCSLTFNDPGNTDYVSASYTAPTFTVAPGSPSGLSILANTASPNGQPGNGDPLVYTYNQVMNASSLLSGFTGTSTAVFVQLTRASSSSTSWQVCSTSTCGTIVKLGTVNLGDASNASPYVAVGGTAVFNATMSMATNSSNESVVTVTLGTAVSGTVAALTPTSSATTLVWTPSGSATSSSGGLACATTAISEAAGPKANF